MVDNFQMYLQLILYSLKLIYNLFAIHLFSGQKNKLKPFFIDRSVLPNTRAKFSTGSEGCICKSAVHYYKHDSSYDIDCNYCALLRNKTF